MVMVICNCLNYFVILIYCIFFHKASRKQHVLQFAIEMEDLTLVKLLCDGGADVNILVLVHDYFVVSLLISKRDNISLKWPQYVQLQYVNKMPYTSLKKQINSYAFLGSQKYWKSKKNWLYFMNSWIVTSVHIICWLCFLHTF